MSLPLTAEEEARYTSIIDSILETADLNTVTRKKIRVGLEEALGGKDLSEQKNAIKKLIEARFDAVSGAGADAAAPVIPPSSNPEPSNQSPLKRQANGHHVPHNGNGDTVKEETDADANADAEIKVSTPEPARKKVKRDPSLDADAKLAAELQAQENRLARGRTTRGSGAGPSKKPIAKKKTTKAKRKSANKVKDDDDSAAGSEESGAPKRKAGGGFQKPFNLSPMLAELCGVTQLSRPQVVKKLWEHIKANDLQDPQDKRQILCDETMLAVFKQPRIDMFQMNKAVGNHLYPVDEE